jgi:hypothetical protein
MLTIRVLCVHVCVQSQRAETPYDLCAAYRGAQDGDLGSIAPTPRVQQLQSELAHAESYAHVSEQMNGPDLGDVDRASASQMRSGMSEPTRTIEAIESELAREAASANPGMKAFMTSLEADYFKLTGRNLATRVKALPRFSQAEEDRLDALMQQENRVLSWKHRVNLGGSNKVPVGERISAVEKVLKDSNPGDKELLTRNLRRLQFMKEEQ